MSKSKIKLSLIEDYINIYIINNFFSNDLTCFKNSNQIQENKTKINNLKVLYETIFEKLKLKDLSFLILIKDLKQNNSLFQCAQKDQNKVENFIIATIKNILLNLPIKLKKLKTKHDILTFSY